MTKFLCEECIHNSDKGGGCLIPKNLGYVDNCNRYLPKDRPIVQTNEEYLRSCDTEQLAESLLNIMANNEFTLYLLHTEKKSMQEMKDAVVEWLKQPHTVKEYNDEND